MSSTFEQQKKHAHHISDNWGKFLTEAIGTGNWENFRSLFHEHKVHVGFQGADGQEIKLVIGTDPDIMSWETFQENSPKDFERQDYKLTRSSLLGLLGNRMNMQFERFNSKDECYMVGTILIEFDDEGKIIGFEAFSDIKAESVICAAAEARAGA